MSEIKLSQETCIDLLKQYISSGYKNTGCISIKDGATIAKYFRILKGQEDNSDKLKVEAIYKDIFKILDVLNTNKAYTLDDAAVLYVVEQWLENNVLNSPEEKESDTDKDVEEVVTDKVKASKGL